MHALRTRDARKHHPSSASSVHQRVRSSRHGPKSGTRVRMQHAARNTLQRNQQSAAISAERECRRAAPPPSSWSIAVHPAHGTNSCETVPSRRPDSAAPHSKRHGGGGLTRADIGVSSAASLGIVQLTRGAAWSGQMPVHLPSRLQHPLYRSPSSHCMHERAHGSLPSIARVRCRRRLRVHAATALHALVPTNAAQLLSLDEQCTGVQVVGDGRSGS
jgi:hypothetical protein